MASITSKGEKDLISWLPDDAIKSTLLVNRFRNLWRSFSNITLDTWSLEMDGHIHSNDDKLAKIIHHVLTYHEKEKIDELSLSHYFFFEFSKNPRYSLNPSPEIQIRILEKKRFASVIDSFVSFAIIKRCKVLTLDFVSTAEDIGLHGLARAGLYIAYDCVYLLWVLVILLLCLKSLKLLRFQAVVMSDEAVHKFMVGCPSLEELSFQYCYGLHNLCCNTLKLKSLMIDHGREQYTLTLSSLNVVFLTISGIDLQSVVLKSNLVDAQVCSFEVLIMHKYERTSYEGFRFLLQAFDQCKTLRPCLWSLKLLYLFLFSYNSFLLGL